MRKIDFSQFSKKVMAIIDANKNSITNLENEEDFSIFTFCGENYACEINLNDKWFGYDLMIEVPEGNIRCDLEDYKYELYSNESLANIFDDLIELVQAIFDKRVSYVSTTEYSYIVVENSKGKYSALYNQKKKRFWMTHASGWWKYEIDKSEFDALNIKSLKILL